MDAKQFEMVGQKAEYEGQTFYSNAYYSFDGLSYGFIYKDERAFYESDNEVCYIPEYAFDDAPEVVINGETYYAVDGYTRKDLESLIMGITDCDGNPIDIEYFFQKLEWAYPETYVNELSYF